MFIKQRVPVERICCLCCRDNLTATWRAGINKGVIVSYLATATSYDLGFIRKGRSDETVTGICGA